MGEESAHAPGAELSVLDHDGEHYAFPASLAQERMWFLQQLDPGSTAYHMSTALRMRGEFDLAAFGAGLGEIVERHEILRTGFRQEDGNLLQVVLPEARVVPEPVDIGGEDVAGWLRAESARPFDLTRAPLLRVVVLRTAPDEHLVLFTMHHIIADGWSLGVLVREVAHAYLHAVRGARADLPELPIQYADYSVWQRDWLDGEDHRRQLEFWRKRLDGAPAESLPPTDRPRVARRHRPAAQHRVRVPADLADRLRALGDREGVPLFSLLYAAFAVLLRRYHGERDVLVGTPIANRHHTELEGLVGFLANTLVLRLDVAGESSLREVLRAAAQTCFDAYEHQDLPFDLLVEDLRPPRVADRQPLFQVMFVLQNAPLRWPALPGLRVETLTLPNTAAKFDLLLEVQPDEDGLTAEFEYATDLYDQATIDQLAGHFLVLLRELAGKPDTSVAAVRLPSPAAGRATSPFPGLFARASRRLTAAEFDEHAGGVVCIGPAELAEVLRDHRDTGRTPEAVLCPSDGLPRELVDDFYRVFACELYSYYQPPGATAPVLAQQCRPGHEWPLLPLGVPVGSDEVVVLDEWGAPAPGRVIGELHLRSGTGLVPLGRRGRIGAGGVVEPEQPGGTTPVAAPRERTERTPTATEQRLLELWRELLGQPGAGLDDSFFALGGHSVLATQLTARVRAAFGTDLPVRAVFEHPTPASLASLLGTRAEAPVAERPALRPAAGRGVVPLSSGQERLWFIDQLAPGNTAYTVLAGVRLTGWLDAAAMSAAVRAVVRRHSVLRTVFRSPSGTPEQIVLDDLEPRITVVDGAAELDEVARLAGEPFDLAAGPLVRAVLIRTAPLRHTLVLALHHAICDGWSLGVLLAEIADAYAGRPRPPLPLQYADYAHWERELRESPAYEAQTAYWLEQLAGAPVLELPLDRPRPPVQTFAGATHSFELSAELSAALGEVADRTGTTEFIVTLAAFQVLLGRWAGQRDVVVGAPIANRSEPELEELVGFFANTLVLRTRWAAEAGFDEVLAEVRHTVLEAQAHQDVPVERIAEALETGRETSRNPLFQVAFAFDNTPRSDVVVPGLVLSPAEFEVPSARFDLTLFLSHRDGAITVAVEYNTDLFDAATIDRFARWYTSTLSAVAGAVTTPVADLPGLSEEDERRLAEWNRTERDFDDAPVPVLTARQAAATPDATALVCGERSLTFRELDQRADHLAQSLRAAGIAPGGIVAVYAERSVELVVSLLAVLKAGGAYLPLNPEHPADRTAFVLDDAQPPVVLAQRSVAAGLGGYPGRIIEVGPETGTGEAVPGPGAGPEDPAYVIYTSGSTGRPKGAVNTHHALSNRLQWMQRRYRIGPGDAVLQKTPFSFDVSVWEFFWPLLTGARLVLAEPGAHRDMGRLAELIERHEVTVVHFVPSVLSSFLAEADPGKLATLRHVVCSGEALTAELRDRFFARCGAELHNLYGPTEAAIDVTHWTCEPGEARATVPIGRPIDNLRVLVLDERLRPVPVGFTGEICLAGAGVGRGYLHRPDLTAERFVPEPGGTGLLYRTGDLGRFGPDGVLDYLGRADDQVKVRGVRIELGEIGATLARHPAVGDAAVVLSGERLAAFAVPDRDAAAPVRALVRARADGVSLGELPGGGVLCQHRRSETEFLYREIFGERAYLRHGVRLDPGARVFDVGANIGVFSLFAHTEATGAEVWAFEPVPQSRALLERNFELHGIAGSVVPYGLGAERERVTFTYYPQVSIVSGQFADPGRDGDAVRAYLAGGENEESAAAVVAEVMRGEPVECELRTLSSVLREHALDRIDLLKIDVESAELAVLTGIEAGDWPSIGQVVAEVHDVGGRLAAVTDLLRHHGFEVVTEPHGTVGGAGLHLVYAIRPDWPAPPPPPGSGPKWTEAGLLDELRAHARRQLPGSMVPSTLTLIPELPVTANGKLDKAALLNFESAAEPAWVAPRDELERALAGAWEAVLGHEGVGATDDFFALGGHSLLLPKLITRITEAAGRTVPLSVLFRETTVARLAAALRKAEPDAPSTVALASAPEGAPRLFLVHPVGGHLLGYRELVSALAGQVAVDGLLAPGIDEGTTLPATVGALAEHHLGLLRASGQPGPFHLAGWSFGGVVAFELARLLGDEVASLTMIDAHLPSAVDLRPEAVLTGFAEDLGLAVDELPRVTGDPRSDLFALATEAGVLPPGVDPERFAGMWEVYRANLGALAAYRPEAWHGRATLLRPAEGGDESWRELLPPGHLEVRELPGDHYSIVRSAECANAVLAAVRAGGG